MSCLAQKQGAMTAEFVNSKIQDVINVHGVDVSELAAQIALINAELDVNETVDGQQQTALTGILNSITALQTSVANNTTSITDVQNTITSAVAGLQASIATERAHVDAEVARLEGLISSIEIPAPYDDSEVRALIQANVEAIGSESATRIAEVARLEGLIAANKTDIDGLKVSVAANAAEIASVKSAVESLSSAVTAGLAAVNARVDSVDACLDAFFNTMNSANCDVIAGSFQSGLNSGNGGAL